MFHDLVKAHVRVPTVELRLFNQFNAKQPPGKLHQTLNNRRQREIHIQRILGHAVGLAQYLGKVFIIPGFELRNVVFHHQGLELRSLEGKRGAL